MGAFGNLVAEVGGYYGQLADNISTIYQNLETLLTQLNDPQSWIVPTPSD